MSKVITLNHLNLPEDTKEVLKEIFDLPLTQKISQDIVNINDIKNRSYTS